MIIIELSRASHGLATSYYYYCADVENCGSFKNFGFIYIYIDI